MYLFIHYQNQKIHDRVRTGKTISFKSFLIIHAHYLRSALLCPLLFPLSCSPFGMLYCTSFNDGWLMSPYCNLSKSVLTIDLYSKVSPHLLNNFLKKIYSYRGNHISWHKLRTGEL